MGLQLGPPVLDSGEGVEIPLVTLAVRVAHHFVVRGGLIARFEQFADTALVRDAGS